VASPPVAEHVGGERISTLPESNMSSRARLEPGHLSRFFVMKIAEPPDDAAALVRAHLATGPESKARRAATAASMSRSRPLPTGVQRLSWRD